MVGKLSLGFHEDITKLMDIFKKNLFPAHLIKGLKIITLLAQSNHCPGGSLPITSPTVYFKLHRPFFCYYSKKDSPFYPGLLQ